MDTAASRDFDLWSQMDDGGDVDDENGDENAGDENVDENAGDENVG